MKKLMIALIALVGFTYQAEARNEKKIKSQIQKVTVYTSGAQVNRKASYAVDKGVTTLVIEGVSPNIVQITLIIIGYVHQPAFIPLVDADVLIAEGINTPVIQAH